MKTTNRTVAAARRSNAWAVLTLAIAALAGMGPAVAACAQGSINLDNSQSPGGVAINQQGNYYTGVYGVEVWELNANVVPPGINPVNTWNLVDVPAAYGSMESAGFQKEATFADQKMSFPGTIRLGELDMPNVAPAGASVVIALAMWDTAAPAFSDAASVWTHGSAAVGVIAFVNPTANYTAFPTPAPPALSGWNTDLIMAVDTIPEPSAFALAGVGAAAWLLARRHRNRR